MRELVLLPRVKEVNFRLESIARKNEELGVRAEGLIENITYVRTYIMVNAGTR